MWRPRVPALVAHNPAHAPRRSILALRASDHRSLQRKHTCHRQMIRPPDIANFHVQWAKLPVVEKVIVSPAQRADARPPAPRVSARLELRQCRNKAALPQPLRRTPGIVLVEI